MKSICIYCSSSTKIDRKYFDAADEVARNLVHAGYELVCGGGNVGLMRQLTDTTISAGGKMTGVIPHFMIDIEQDHKDLTKCIAVNTMYERKQKFLELSDAIVVLPGGCGTLEEFLEAMTLKRLGRIKHPMIVLNQDGFYDPLLSMLDRMISQRFMHQNHIELWSVVDTPNEVVPGLQKAPDWGDDSLQFAVVK